MFTWENKLWAENYQNVIGIDEAGRGPLAGPVCIAGVIFSAKQKIPSGIDDSKKLSPAKREQLFTEIINSAYKYEIVFISPARIDKINILNAVKEGMRKVAIKLTPDFVLTDAVNINLPNVPQLALIKGDSLSVSIAAGSILAKVSRDRLMTELAKKYPQYGFEQNMGYGTKDHLEAIRIYGLTSIHRRSFTTSIIN